MPLSPTNKAFLKGLTIIVPCLGGETDGSWLFHLEVEGHKHQEFFFAY